MWVVEYAVAGEYYEVRFDNKTDAMEFAQDLNGAVDWVVLSEEIYS